MRLTNVAWSIAGLALPLVIAVVIIPPLIAMIGLDRFGLLALAWGLIGYAGVFDLGIGRATTQYVAQLRGLNHHADIPQVIQSASRLTLVSGTMGWLLLTISAMLGVQNLIQYPAGLERELTISVFLLAVAVPVQAISATYRGINEAYENFRGISLLRMVLGILNFLGPYWMAHYSVSLVSMVATLLISRMIALGVFHQLAMHCIRREAVQPLNSFITTSRTNINKRLLAFGGWVTVSSIIGPLLVQADRFVIAGVISAAAVAAYTIPYEAVVQTLFIVGAVSSVAFPSLAKQMHQDDGRWQASFRTWLRGVTWTMLVVTSAMALLLPTLLPLWMGSSLPPESVLVGQILCLGVFANSIGSMYYSLLHAKGRSDITAKLHLVELPIFFLAIYWLIHPYGLYGVAWAWVGRTVLDAIFLKILSKN